MEATAENHEREIVVKSGGGIGNSGTIALVVGGAAALYFGKKYLDQRKENAAEAQTDTPEGQIALQLKTVFDKFPVSDADYKAAWLQVNAQNKAKVFELYRNLTGRNLSDDIASHISTDSQAKATKVEKYNSKPGKLFSIAADGKIQFEVSPSAQIRFAPGQTTPVNMYTIPTGILLKEIEALPNGKAAVDKLRKDPATAVNASVFQLKPSARLFTVTAVKEVPFKALQEATGWTKYLRPYVNTSKTFAMVQILLGTDPTSKKKILRWIDARDMVTAKQKTVQGLGNLHLVA